MPLTTGEKELAAAIAFDEDVCELVKKQTGGTLGRLSAFTEEYDARDANGLSVAVERQDVERLIVKLQPELAPRGYRAFWSEIRESNGLKKSEEIVVLKTTDHHSIIEIRRPDGANYGVSTDDVVTKLKEWETHCQFEVLGAGSAWVAIQFQTLPEDICAFAEEIYDFCPDTVEQGVGLMNESDDPEAFEAARRLCPQLSAKMEKKLAEQKQRFQQIDIPPQLREMLESGAGGFTTPTDTGIRLLRTNSTNRGNCSCGGISAGRHASEPSVGSLPTATRFTRLLANKKSPMNRIGRLTRIALTAALLLALLAVLDAAVPASTAAESPKPDVAPPNVSSLALWYRQPAKGWEEALPIGNGHMGAMVYGGVPTEHIQLNEHTVWTGHPHSYAHESAVKALPEDAPALARDAETGREAFQLDPKGESIPAKKKLKEARAGRRKPRTLA